MVLDRDLIEASFAMQYGIRLAVEDIGFGEYCRLLAGLMGDTPLGRVVAVRAERDVERIKRFGEYENGIRRRWREFRRANHPSKEGNLEELQGVLERVFG